MPEQLRLPQVKIEEVTPSNARFVAEPLERGMGTTVGNALRRMLLSGLHSAAVTWVKIEGVSHEFSPIPEMKEDTIEFLLNVKGIRLRPLTERPGKLFLEVEGEGVVTAGDIQPAAEFEVVNPELYLATLNSPQAKLSVEFNVEQGKGYLPAGKSDGLPTGALPVDAIFSPVRQVNYTVEPVRVGQQTGYERLVLEVWSDGTISAVEAVSSSASLLTELFTLFAELAEVSLPGVARRPRLAIPPEQYDTPIEEMNFSVRTYNALKRGSISTLGELLERSPHELMDLRQFGPKSMDEVKERLQLMGYWTEELEIEAVGTEETEETEETAEPEELEARAGQEETEE